MSKFTDRYNKGGHYEKSTPKNAKYYKLAQLQEKKVYPVDALYINTKGKFGDSGVILSGDSLINLPQHLTPTIKEMRADQELTDDINKGYFGFTVYRYEGSNGTGFSVNWCDIVPDNEKTGEQINVSDDDLPF